MPGNESEKGKF